MQPTRPNTTVLNQPSPLPDTSAEDIPAKQLRFLLEPEQQARIETDAELLARFLYASDRSAMEKLVIRYSPLVASICRLNLCNPSDAEDAFQATFLILMRSANKIRHKNSLAAWLHGVAYRTASRLRSQRRRSGALRSGQSDQSVAGLQPAIHDDPLVELARSMELEMLNSELTKLPGKLQAPLVEHYLLGYSVAEIAFRMDLSISAVEGRLRRGRRLLRTRLASRGVSLSIIMAASGWFQQHVHAANTIIWTNNLLPHCGAGGASPSDPASSPDVSALIRGELSMATLPPKLAITAGLLAIAGSLAAYSVIAEGPGARATGDSALVLNSQDAQEQADLAPFSLAGGPSPSTVGQTTPVASKDADGSDNPFAEDRKLADSPSDSFGSATSTPTKQSGDKREVLLPTNGLPSATLRERPAISWQRPFGETPRWMESATRSRQKFEAAYDKLQSDLPNELAFNGQPLNQVIKILANDYQCPIFIDLAELENDGIASDAPITLERPGPISLRAALKQVLRPLSLTYTVREYGIEITTLASVEREPVLRYYDLSFVLPSAENASHVVQTIFSSIDPDRWIASGGTSTLSMISSVMVISAPLTTHEKIEEFLGELTAMNLRNTTPKLFQMPVGAGMGMGGGMF
ncbi:MAG: sigma-70 family RNA polymerase sigma factor [Pirellulaceae bacterium]|nr:sigma-70 family RNA polymerase sigma factor [Pirellulaceae bacterium]